MWLPYRRKKYAFGMSGRQRNKRRALEEKKCQEELDFLKYQGQHLDTFLKSLGGGK